MITIKDPNKAKQLFEPEWFNKADQSQVDQLAAQLNQLQATCRHLSDQVVLQKDTIQALKQQVSTLEKRLDIKKQPMIAKVQRGDDGKIVDIEIREKPFFLGN